VQEAADQTLQLHPAKAGAEAAPPQAKGGKLQAGWWVGVKCHGVGNPPGINGGGLPASTSLSERFGGKFTGLQARPCSHQDIISPLRFGEGEGSNSPIVHHAWRGRREQESISQPVNSGAGGLYGGTFGPADRRAREPGAAGGRGRRPRRH